jgi:hypothetical protein
MKNVFKTLMLFAVTFSFSQTSAVQEEVTMDDVKVSNINVSVTVDSAEEIFSTFDVKDLKELIELSDQNEPLSFEIICNGDKMSNGKNTTLTYRVKGNTNDTKDFLKSVKKVRKAAIKYYKNK